jgi:hypothetical protein
MSRRREDGDAARIKICTAESLIVNLLAAEV